MRNLSILSGLSYMRPYKAANFVLTDAEIDLVVSPNIINVPLLSYIHRQGCQECYKSHAQTKGKVLVMTENTIATFISPTITCI